MSNEDRALPADRATAVEPVPVSPLRDGIPSATVTEHSSPMVSLFLVRDGWEWASIFVRPVKDGAEVVAHSTFGTYGYTWGAMGGDWREFLSSCSREYAMRKLAALSYDVPLNHEEFVATMRAELDDFEKSVTDAWGILDSDQDRRLKACREALDEEWGWEDVPQEALFWHFNEAASGAPYAIELYETRLSKINPQVVGFWDVIWAPFAEHLRRSLAQGMEAATADETGTGSAVGDSPVLAEDAPNSLPNPLTGSD